MTVVVRKPSYRQLRAARAHFGWSRRQVSEKTGLTQRQISYAEEVGNNLASTTLQLRTFYEVHGIVFTSFDGIARHPKVKNSETLPLDI